MTLYDSPSQKCIQGFENAYFSNILNIKYSFSLSLCMNHICLSSWLSIHLSVYLFLIHLIISSMIRKYIFQQHTKYSFSQSFLYLSSLLSIYLAVYICSYLSVFPSIYNLIVIISSKVGIQMYFSAIY